MLKINKSYLDFHKYKNYTYLEVLLSLNIHIPHICYHKQLPISGKCRVCLGIIGADRKPAPLCATSVRPNDIVDYSSPRVRRLREDVLEFLLIKHPLDCPSCDQGGECDLQDYSYNYGSDRSRHTISFKKTILKKERGILIKTVMNRCINCTRCIRFFSEVIGKTIVGVMGRGIHSEISSFINQKFNDSELSGNVIDLCPVGALTSNVNKFINRAWNLTHLASFDALDSLGSSIVLHLHGTQIVRVNPGIKYTLNMKWISDKIRFIFTGLYKQRLIQPLYKTINGIFKPLTWTEVFYTLKKDLKTTISKLNLGCYFGELLSNETIYTASTYMKIIGKSKKYSLQDSLFISNDFVSNFLFNSKVASVSQTDCCILIGSKLKSELPVLNIRLRKQYLATALPIIMFGMQTKLMYPTYFLGFTLNTLIKFIEGRSIFCKLLCSKKQPLFLINLKCFLNETLSLFFDNFKQILIKKLHLNFNNFKYIYADIKLYNQLYLNINTKYKDVKFNKLDCLYLLNVNNKFETFMQSNILSSIYIIYQGHHYTSYIDKARMVLPIKPYLYDTGSFINLQGDVLTNSDLIVNDQILVKDQLTVLYGVFSTLFENLKISFMKILKTNDILKTNPILQFKTILNKTSDTLYVLTKFKTIFIKNYLINSLLYNFYLNDNISLASETMFTCTKTLITKNNY